MGTMLSLRHASRDPGDDTDGVRRIDMMPSLKLCNSHTDGVLRAPERLNTSMHSFANIARVGPEVTVKVSVSSLSHVGECGEMR